MSIIEKNTKIGKLYISNKTYKMALEYNGEIISDQAKVWSLLDENRIPVRAQIEITQKCNFDCYYCYERSLRNRKDMSLKEVKKVLDILEEIGVVFLEITGGEPLARTDILEVLKYINQKGFIISMITNGSRLTEEIAAELSRGCLNSVRLSLLAGKEETNDMLTKVKGSYQKTKNAIKILKKYQLNFFVTSVITNQNIDEYDYYKEFEKELDIEISFQINAGAPFEGYSEVEEYELKKKHFEQLKQYIKVKEKSLVRQELVCSGGKSKFAIDNQGNLLCCVKLRSTYGNILTQNFKELWESVKVKEIIEKELVRPVECKKCEKRYYCEAYCPAEYKYFEDDESRCRVANLLTDFYNC